MESGTEFIKASSTFNFSWQIEKFSNHRGAYRKNGFTLQSSVKCPKSMLSSDFIHKVMKQIMPRQIIDAKNENLVTSYRFLCEIH
jgi:hypothetical protein